MRSELLVAKGLEIQQMLEVWAKENNILDAGERIVFSDPRIEGVPIVVREMTESVEYLKQLPVEEFFSTERLVAIGTPKNIAGAINSAILNFCGGSYTGGRFAARFTTTKRLCGEVRHIGVSRAQYVMKALEVLR